MTQTKAQEARDRFVYMRRLCNEIDEIEDDTDEWDEALEGLGRVAYEYVRIVDDEPWRNGRKLKD